MSLHIWSFQNLKSDQVLALIFKIPCIWLGGEDGAQMNKKKCKEGKNSLLIRYEENIGGKRKTGMNDDVTGAAWRDPFR